MIKGIRYAFLALVLAIAAGSAKADSTLLSYTLTGPDTASFTLAVNPTVADSLNQFGFDLTPTNLVVDGVHVSDLLFFYSGDPMFLGVPVPGPAGGLSGFIFPSLVGPQLYSGPESAPTMLTGTFALTDFDTGTEKYTLVVAPVSTPEPATLALFGVGLLGMAIFYRRRTAFNN